MARYANRYTVAKGFLSFILVSNRLNLGCRAGPHHRKDTEMRDATGPNNTEKLSDERLCECLPVPLQYGALFEVLPPFRLGCRFAYDIRSGSSQVEGTKMSSD